MGPDDSLLENFARNVDHDILVPSPESGTANVTPNEGLRQERKALLDKLKTLSLDGNLTSITVDEAKECFAVGYRMACMPHDCSDR